MEENLQKGNNFFSKCRCFFSKVVDKWDSFWNKPNVKKLTKPFRNQTFIYILKRVLSSCFTLVLLVALVAILIRLLPETKFYDIKLYKTISGKAGVVAAERYRVSQLFKYGFCDQQGTPRSIFYSAGLQIYYLLPIYKKIPMTWTDNTYSVVKDYWTGFIFLGKSVQRNQYVIDMIKDGMAISMIVSLITVAGTYLISVPFGIAMAKKPGGIVDKIGNIFIVLNYAIPALVFYLIMNRAMGDKDGIFGAFNFGFFYDETRPQSLIPPIFCVIFLGIPGVFIWIRRYMIDELSSDYGKFARSKGLSENRIMYTHVLRNACVPLVRGIPGTLLGAFVGSYFIETIWTIPGTGRLLTSGLQGFDVPVIQGLTILYAAISMLSFLLGDIVTVFFDPRIRITSQG